MKKRPKKTKKDLEPASGTNPFFVWYNLVEMKTTPRRYYTPRQGKIPVFVSDFLSISDPVLAFDRFMEGIDLSKYLKNIPEYQLGKIVIKDEDLMSKIEEFTNAFNARLDRVQKHFEQKVEEVQRGDDLLPGVLKQRCIL